MVELAPLRDEGQVPSAVAAALSFETSTFDTPEALHEHLISHLATRRTLVLLDNCEHLLQAVARFVHALVTRCPAVSVLATSRERLGVPGRWRGRCPRYPCRLPLRLPRSSLAAMRWRFSVSGCEPRLAFELDSTNAAAVVRICRRLDGIPLALELAAARIQVLSPAQLASRLDDRFRC
jgi:predicted ATPase